MVSQGDTLTTALGALGASADLVSVVLAVAEAARQIAHDLRGGALHGLHGRVGSANVQGEEQEKLDVAADRVLRARLAESGVVYAIASEEQVDVETVGESDAPYLVAYDPLDGSSNIDVNISVGSIFSVRPHRADRTPLQSFLAPGSEQVAAGYVLYGHNVQLVLTLGEGVHGFTLHPDAGDFRCTSPQMIIPTSAREFAINASNRRRWDAPVRRWYDEYLLGTDGPIGRDYNMRWIATLVAEVHRILVRGGVFSYPVDARLTARGLPGRLRMVYELAPMSMLIEAAGGRASTGRDVLSTQSAPSLHARAPAFLGARDDVARVEQYYRDADDA